MPLVHLLVIWEKSNVACLGYCMLLDVTKVFQGRWWSFTRWVVLPMLCACRVQLLGEGTVFAQSGLPLYM